MARRVVLLAASAAAFAPTAPQRRPVLNLRATATDVETDKEESCVSFTVPVPASLTKAAYKTAAGEMAQTREIPGWRQKDWKKVPIGVVAGAVGAQTLKSLAIEKLTETEVHSAITGLGVEVVGQAQLVGDVEEIMQTFTPGEPWDMRVKIDIWPEAVWSQPWDDGTLAVEVEREAKDQSTRDKALEALDLGAVEVMAKPGGSHTVAEMGRELVEKVKAAARVKSSAHQEARRHETTRLRIDVKASNKVIAIGASTGGTQALKNVFTRLPATAPGIVVVQHMPPLFTRSFAERLNEQCEVAVKEAEDGDARGARHRHGFRGGHVPRARAAD